MISSAPETVRRFISDQLLNYAARGYRVTLHPGKKITVGGMTYTGEATAEKLEIAVGGDWQDWFGIFVHETCHLDQHIEEPSTFARADGAMNRIADWLDKKTDTVAREDFHEILHLESDCENRVLRKAVESELPIDLGDYTRRANAYLQSYAVALRHRRWIPQPYSDFSICAQMPQCHILTVDEVLSERVPVVPDSEFLRLANPAD